MTNEQEPSIPKDQEPFVPQSLEPPAGPPVEPKKQKRGGKILMQLLPGLFVLLLAVALVVVGLALSSGPTVATPNKVDFSSELSTAKSRYDLNNSSAASAPQQSVVNGWYTNDLLIVLTNAVSDSANGYSAVTANQQEILNFNKKLMFLIWISMALLMVALAGYFMLSRLPQRD